MHTGILWFDDTESTLENKIQKAITYYTKKYNSHPNLVLVHPNMLSDKKIELGGITIKPYRPVLPGHIWIGFEDKE
jgi:hypothetical protein